MYDTLIALVAGLVLSGIGWVVTKIRLKTSNDLVLTLVKAIEKLDAEDVKRLVEKLTEKSGLKQKLDGILSKLDFLKTGVPLLLVALILLPGCGLLSSGTSGAGGELGSVVQTTNVNVYDLRGYDNAKVVEGEDGKLTVQATKLATKEGDNAEAQGGGPVLYFGREALKAYISSAGQNTGASQAGGSGDVSPTFPTLGTGTTAPIPSETPLHPVE